MVPSPKIPNDKNQSDTNHSSTDEFSHPSIHLHQEYNASADDDLTTSSDEDHPSTDEISNGYHRLPQETNSSSGQNFDQIAEQNGGDEEEKFRRFVLQRIQTSIDEMNNDSSLNSDSHLVESVWSTNLTSETLPVDDVKAEYIKSFMSSITLPESSIPHWARTCSEDEWKEKLRQRMICQQTTFFLDQD